MKRNHRFLQSYIATTLLVLATSAAYAQTPISFDITDTTGATFAASDPGNTGSNEGVASGFDNNNNTKYLSFVKNNVVFTITPGGGATVVSGIGFVTANDSSERDPLDYIVFGSNDNTNYTQIATGNIELPFDRGQRGTAGFYNDSAAYSSYRVQLPNVRNNGAANSIQFAELELTGTLRNVTPGYVSDILNGGSVTLGNGSTPAGEGVENLIDNNFATKYLNTLETGSFVTFTPLLTQTVVTELAITSANDFAGRDPASFILSGSNDGTNFLPISTGSVPAFRGRFNEQVLSFSNTTAYDFYRLTIPTVAEPGNGLVQFAEVRLGGTVGTVVPEPASAGLLIIGGCTAMGLISRRRNSQKAS